MRYRDHLDVGNCPNKHYHCCSVQSASPPPLRDDATARACPPEQLQVQGHLQELVKHAKTTIHTGPPVDHSRSGLITVTTTDGGVRDGTHLQPQPPDGPVDPWAPALISSKDQKKVPVAWHVSHESRLMGVAVLAKSRWPTSFPRAPN